MPPWEKVLLKFWYDKNFVIKSEDEKKLYSDKTVGVKFYPSPTSPLLQRSTSEHYEVHFRLEHSLRGDFSFRLDVFPWR